MEIHYNCKFVGKEVVVNFRRDVVENGNGPDKIYEIPTKCSQPKCPNFGKCIYTQEKFHWE